MCRVKSVLLGFVKSCLVSRVKLCFVCFVKFCPILVEVIQFEIGKGIFIKMMIFVKLGHYLESTSQCVSMFEIESD